MAAGFRARDPAIAVVVPPRRPRTSCRRGSAHAPDAPGRPLGRRLRPPQPAARLPRLPLQPPEPVEVAEGEPRVGVAVAPPNDLRVDEGPVPQIDVGKRAAVAVAPLAVVLQADALPSSRRFVKALASRPKNSTGLRGSTVSGVSTPINRTRPTPRTTMVSPSTTRSTSCALARDAARRNARAAKPPHATPRPGATVRPPAAGPRWQELTHGPSRIVAIIAYTAAAHAPRRGRSGAITGGAAIRSSAAERVAGSRWAGGGVSAAERRRQTPNPRVAPAGSLRRRTAWTPEAGWAPGGAARRRMVGYVAAVAEPTGRAQDAR